MDNDGDASVHVRFSRNTKNSKHILCAQNALTLSDNNSRLAVRYRIAIDLYVQHIVYVDVIWLAFSQERLGCFFLSTQCLLLADAGWCIHCRSANGATAADVAAGLAAHRVSSVYCIYVFTREMMLRWGPQSRKIL